MCHDVHDRPLRDTQGLPLVEWSADRTTGVGRLTRVAYRLVGALPGVRYYAATLPNGTLSDEIAARIGPDHGDECCMAELALDAETREAVRLLLLGRDHELSCAAGRAATQELAVLLINNLPLPWIPEMGSVGRVVEQWIRGHVCNTCHAAA